MVGMPCLCMHYSPIHLTGANNEQKRAPSVHILRENLQEPCGGAKTPPCMHYVVVQLPSRVAVHHVPKPIFQ
jgi:hypothetical protein